MSTAIQPADVEPAAEPAGDVPPESTDLDTNAHAADSVATSPTIRLDQAALNAGSACVQCGLCLPTCPTYLETSNEAESPRGRIRLMLGLHDGDVPYTDLAKDHLDGCLGCRACETACPSGVAYHKLYDDALEKLTADRIDGGDETPKLTRLQRFLFLGLLARPNRLRASLAVARIADRVGLRIIARKLGLLGLMGQTVERMDAMLPRDDDAPIWPKPLPAHSRAGGMDMVVQMLDPARAEKAEQVSFAIGFFEGCVASVMSSGTHKKAAEMLCRAGADVVSPPDQVCCGAIHQHAGEGEHARQLARSNIDTFLPTNGPEVRFITTCTAGDGAMLRGYGELLADDPRYAERAKRFSDLVRDISEVFVEVGLGEGDLRFRNRIDRRVAYHDACHLAHAQGVRTPPRTLLEKVPGLEVVDLPEGEICCGAAGTYNLTRPQMAGQLARRKLDALASTGADLLISGNIGCSMHLASIARDTGSPIEVVHPVDLLHEAMFG
jgi:glycolate oxidase iron-sulfur subunit